MSPGTGRRGWFARVGKGLLQVRGFTFHFENVRRSQMRSVFRNERHLDWLVFRGQFECRYDTFTSQVSASKWLGLLRRVNKATWISWHVVSKWWLSTLAQHTGFLGNVPVHLLPRCRNSSAIVKHQDTVSLRTAQVWGCGYVNAGSKDPLGCIIQEAHVLEKKEKEEVKEKKKWPTKSAACLVGDTGTVCYTEWKTHKWSFCLSALFLSHGGFCDLLIHRATVLVCVAKLQHIMMPTVTSSLEGFCL